MEIPRPLTTTTLARYCHVSHAAVCNWAKAGKLRVYRTPGGQYRIEPQVALAFMKQHGMPVPEELGYRGARKIVVVDDEVQILDLVQRVLGKSGAGYDVQIFSDSYSAGRAVHTLAPDLVLLDIRMPGIDGVTVCRSIKSDPATAKTQVLIITAYATDENVRKLRQMGVEKVIEKPFSVSHLTATVRSMIEEPQAIR